MHQVQASHLTIIIPVAPKDRAWTDLLADLVPQLDSRAEILLVGPEVMDLPDALAARKNVAWLQTERGRAKQMNAAARQARGGDLWFLHADSRVPPDALAELRRCRGKSNTSLHYFNLRFAADGPSLMVCNAAGVWWRSHVFGLPFGDQGFCLSKELFKTLGGYNEEAPFGEDHLLVWQARRHRLELRCTGMTITTSARKYRECGWLTTTLRHSIWTWKQAAAEWRKMQMVRQ